MTQKSRFILVVMWLSIFASPELIVAQAGRDSEPTVTTQEKQEIQTPTNAANLEKIKLIQSNGFENFIRDLNDSGKLGYRLDKSLSYGGEGVRQSYAAVLRLDPGNTYEYTWISSPNRSLLDLRLNAQAKQGFNFANTFALTVCSDEAKDAGSDPTVGPLSMLQYLKGDAFLLERQNGSTTQNREYKVFTGKLGPGKDTKKNIQAALDAAPPGFRPVKILLSKEGFLDFRVSVLLEKNLAEDNPPKVEYRFVKEVSGFDKAVNTLAAQGFHFLVGRRMGLVKFALLAKQANEPTAYTFLDDEEHAKKFDKTIAQGNSYYGLMGGDVTCDSTEVVNQKLVFAQNSGGEKREYKILNIFNTKTGNQSGALAEFQRLVSANYQVRDIFYSGGLYVIFEK